MEFFSVISFFQIFLKSTEKRLIFWAGYSKIYKLDAEMAEWSIAHDSKSC